MKHISTVKVVKCFSKCMKIRPRNINWQDWKYTSFVILSCNIQDIRRHSAICEDLLVADVIENIGLKFLFQGRFSIHLFHAMNRKYLCRMNVLNNYILYLIVTPWLKWLSICKMYVKSNGLKLEFQSNVFDDVRHKIWIREVYCDVECFDCDVYFQPYTGITKP